MSPGEGNAMPLVFGEGNGPRDEYPRAYERNVNIQIIDAGGSQFSRASVAVRCGA